MKNEEAQHNSAERRRFFRIDDEIMLFYRAVPFDEISQEPDVSQGLPDTFALSGGLESLSQESRVLLRKLERNQPDISNYLKILDRKIDLLAQTLLVSQTAELQQPTRNVNLSAAGVAFETENKLNPNDYVELKMILPPALLALVTYGNVVYCEESESTGENARYRVGVDFLNLVDRDREILIRHIIKKQMLQLRDRRESS